MDLGNTEWYRKITASTTEICLNTIYKKSFTKTNIIMNLQLELNFTLLLQ